MKSNTQRFLVAIMMFTNPFIIKAQVNVQDSLILVDFYNSTDGANWYYKDNWLTARPVETWQGVGVSAGRVTQLEFKVNNIGGTLPHSIGGLSALTSLTLQQNIFSGPLPVELGQLLNLTTLNISFTPSLTDTLPASLGNLTALTVLNFESNGLTGSIPASLGSLSKLTMLQLNNNQLSGNLPAQLANIAGLKYMLLHDNKLTGPIPPGFANLGNLINLELEVNQLTGNIPSALSKLVNAKFLFLNNNNLTGGVPASLGNLVNITSLRLEGNRLSGALPASLSKLPAYSLNVQGNLFTFNGMETLPVGTIYSPQAQIDPIRDGNNLYIKAGGTLANNTYKLYKNLTYFKTQTGDSAFTITDPGNYYITTTNAIATHLTLYSDTLTFTSLPLNLLHFTGAMQHNAALLAWQTTEEINTGSFTVERCVPGSAFITLGTVAAAGTQGTHTYSFTDEAPQQGTNYYRLKMIDRDGAFTYTNIVKVKIGDGKFALSVYPNPAADEATLNFNNIAGGRYTVTITNMAGKQVNYIKGVGVPGANTLLLNLHNYAQGVYLITIAGTDGRHTLKLVKK